MISFDSIKEGNIGRAKAARLIADAGVTLGGGRAVPRIGYETKIYDGKEGAIYIVHEGRGFRIRKYYDVNYRFPFRNKAPWRNVRRSTKAPAEPPRKRSNPRGRPGAFKIYDDLVSIVARKRTAATTGGNAKRRGTYEHKFKTPGTSIFGLPDGSLLIKGSKPLWEKNDESRYEL